MWGRLSAGVLAGFPLSAAMSGLLVALLPLSLEASAVLIIVLILPVWVGVISAAFMAPPGWRAWVWLLALNLCAFALLWATRMAGWLEMPA